jgi:subtilisin-like proprotein convertase family protein
MKSFAFVWLLLPLAANAATTFTNTWTVSTVIPDNDDLGYSDTRTISAPQITSIAAVTVGLNLSGGWNGDLYAYLVHDSGFAVLLNRPGRDIATPDGSAAIGMTIILDDAASSDIHTGIAMSGGPVTGIWQPDGRTSDPLAVLAGDPRTAMLGSFVGMDANGSWTLFVADQSPGGVSTLDSWTLTITGIPEPSVALLATLASLGLLRRRRAEISARS